MDWDYGYRTTKTLRRLAKRLEAKFSPSLYCTDEYQSYLVELPRDRLVRSNRITSQVESVNGNLRHWIGRFRHKSKIVSRASRRIKVMVQLFAYYRTNKHMDELRQQFLPLIA